MMNKVVNDINSIQKYLEFGMRLSLTIKFGPKDEYDLQCKLIGMKESQFLLLDLSQKSVEDLITRKTNNVNVIVRGISNTGLGHIIAFKSKIITLTSRPTWLMFIRLPHHFESKAVRSNKRFKLELPATVSCNDTTTNAVLKDLSASGCRIYVDPSCEIDKESIVTVQPELKYFPTPCPECRIASIRRYKDGTMVGVEFTSGIEMTDNLKYEILDHESLQY